MTETVLNRVSYDKPRLSDVGDEDVETFNFPSDQFTVGVSECKIIRDDFGFYKECETDEGKIIYRFTLLNKDVTVQILTYGATITAITMPDKKGVIDDVVMGFDSYDEYRNPRNPYFGGTIGRITGIIPNCEITIEDEKFFPSNNFLQNHHCNGGYVGFDKVLWNSFVANDKLYLTYMSEDEEEGFPGEVLVTRCYELTKENELIIETTAKVSKPTPIDISTHVDWNLYGHAGGPEEMYKHYLMVNADKYAQLDKDYFMTGKLKKVSRTILDLRIPRPLGRVIHKVPGGGFDHFVSLTRGSRKNVTFAAKLMHPESGRYIEVLCDQPGLLIYTQNNLYAHKNMVEGHPISCWVNDPSFLLQYLKGIEIDMEGEGEELINEELDEFVQNEAEDDHGEGEGEVCSEKPEYGPLIGKQNTEYVRHGGIRLVPINYPETVARRRQYANYVINPGETYLNTTIYRMGTVFEKPQNLAEVIV